MGDLKVAKVSPALAPALRVGEPLDTALSREAKPPPLPIAAASDEPVDAAQEPEQQQQQPSRKRSLEAEVAEPSQDANSCEEEAVVTTDTLEMTSDNDQDSATVESANDDEDPAAAQPAAATDANALGTVRMRKRKRSKRLGFSNNRSKAASARKRQGLQIAAPCAGSDSGDQQRLQAPHSPLFAEPTQLYPSATADEPAWRWDSCDVYFDAITQQHLDDLAKVRIGCANVVAANPDACRTIEYAGTERAQLEAMRAEATDRRSARVRSIRRGRYYRDVWEEEDYFAMEARKKDASCGGKKRAASESQEVLLSNADLVHGYDDEKFSEYIEALERRVHGLNHQAITAEQAVDAAGKDQLKDPRRHQRERIVLNEEILPKFSCEHVHPAACGSWKLKKQQGQYDLEVIHPAAISRDKVPARWREEREAQQQLEEENEDCGEKEDQVNGNNSVEEVSATVESSNNEQDTEACLRLASFGEVLEEDEVSRTIDASLVKLIPLSMHNWRVALSTLERARCYMNCRSILEAEEAAVSRIEDLFRELYPSATESSEQGMQGTERERDPVRKIELQSRPEDLFAYSMEACSGADEEMLVRASVEYTLTLRVGDEVDVLDRNACWNEGVVLDLYIEGGRAVKYVLMHLSLWSSESPEWISVTEGRILPRGVATGKMAFVLAPVPTRKQRLEFNQRTANILERTYTSRQAKRQAISKTRPNIPTEDEKKRLPTKRKQR